MLKAESILSRMAVNTAASTLALVLGGPLCAAEPADQTQPKAQGNQGGLTFGQLRAMDQAVRPFVILSFCQKPLLWCYVDLTLT